MSYSAVSYIRHSLIFVATIVCLSLFCYVVPSKLFSFAIFLMGKKREWVVLYFNCHPDVLFVCLFVLLLYVPSQQLWSLRDGQFT